MNDKTELEFNSIEDVIEGVFLDTCIYPRVEIGRETVEDDLGVAYQDFVIKASYNDRTKSFPLIFDYSKIHALICEWILNENSEIQ